MSLSETIYEPFEPILVIPGGRIIGQIHSLSGKGPWNDIQMIVRFTLVKDQTNEELHLLNCNILDSDLSIISAINTQLSQLIINWTPNNVDLSKYLTKIRYLTTMKYLNFTFQELNEIVSEDDVVSMFRKPVIQEIMDVRFESIIKEA
jgi:hypothetical protein